MTPYEFSLLMDRHILEVRWHETMAAVQPALYAEAHRDAKKQKRSFTLDDFTLTGMFRAAKRAEREAKKQKTPDMLWAKIGMMFGGK
jgi:hypothetical protein